jgi:hypothetical protein
LRRLLLLRTGLEAGLNRHGKGGRRQLDRRLRCAAVDDKRQPDGAAAEHDERLLLLVIFCAVAGAVGRQPLLIAVFVACMASMSHWLEPSLPSAMATQGIETIGRCSSLPSGEAEADDFW